MFSFLLSACCGRIMFGLVHSFVLECLPLNWFFRIFVFPYNTDLSKLFSIKQLEVQDTPVFSKLFCANFFCLRDRTFNLKGGGGDYGFLFRSEICFRTIQEYLFFLAQFFFPEFNIRLYDKNSESDYFLSSTKIRIFFSATLRIRIFFLEKK